MFNGEEDTAQELRSLIQEQEQWVVLSLDKERRLNLIELARAVDNLVVRQVADPEWAGSPRGEDLAHLISFGLHKALFLTLDESSKYPGAPLYKSTPKLQSWADSVLQHLGRVGYCEHLLELNRVGLSEIVRVGPNKYYVRPTSSSIGLEMHEREHFYWVREFISQTQAPLSNSLKASWESIRKVMAPRVNSWMTHYIQYTTLPEIDSFYETEGLLKAQLMFGQDSFPQKAKFGGQEFGLYCAAVAILIGWSIKHLGFCFELLKKSSEIDLRNILTITKPLEDVIRDLAMSLQVDQAAAKQAVDVLTLTFENKKDHCWVAGNLIAPGFIEIGDKKLLRPLWSSFSEPFLFMLRELRRRYRSDWDNAVNEREQSFRNELYLLFPQDRFFKLDRNANLKLRGKLLTDIDALIFDRQTGVLGLFQLKWQDFFGNSMRERESRKVNLLHTGNQWIERVISWLTDVDVGTVAQTFGLKKEDAARMKSFKLFMIGRNSTFFSGDGEPDARAAWGLWYQVLRSMSERYRGDNPLHHLFEDLQKDSPRKKPLPHLEIEEFKIGDVTIAFGP